MIGRLRAWFRHELWTLDLRQLPRPKALGVGALRVSLHAWSSFRKNLVGIQAAGLTMVTLLSLVPVLWLGFGVARAMGLDTQLQAGLLEWLEAWFREWRAGELPPAVQDMLERLQTSLEAVSLKTLGLFGVLLLGYAGYALFHKVERSINQVWLVHGQRSWYGRLGAFSALVLLVPPLIFLALLVESLLHSSATVATLREHLPWLAALYDWSLGFLPLGMLAAALVCVYKLMPSARVRWSAAAGAGAVVALAMTLLHGLYFRSQAMASQFSVVYGVLASVPLLLIYLSLMWTLVLAGAQLSFAIQHVHALRAPEAPPPLSFRARRRLALLLMTDLADRGAAPLEVAERAQDWDLPVAWLEDVAADLEAAGLVTRDEAGAAGLQLSADGRAASALEVLRAVEGLEGGVAELPLPDELEQHLVELEQTRQRLLGGC